MLYSNGCLHIDHRQYSFIRRRQIYANYCLLLAITNMQQSITGNFYIIVQPEFHFPTFESCRFLGRKDLMFFQSLEINLISKAILIRKPEKPRST